MDYRLTPEQFNHAVAQMRAYRVGALEHLTYTVTVAMIKLRFTRPLAWASERQATLRAVLGLKDANLALAAGEAVGVPLPSGNVWRDRLVGALAHGEGEHDWAVMAKDQARASGLEGDPSWTSG